MYVVKKHLHCISSLLNKHISVFYILILAQPIILCDVILNICGVVHVGAPYWSWGISWHNVCCCWCRQIFVDGTPVSAVVVYSHHNTSGRSVVHTHAAHMYTNTYHCFLSKLNDWSTVKHSSHVKHATLISVACVCMCVHLYCMNTLVIVCGFMVVKLHLVTAWSRDY